MSDNTLLDRCRINTNIDGDTFVGIQRKEEKYIVNFPIGFCLGNNEKTIRKDIILLINILEQNLNKKESMIANGEKGENIINIPVQSYLYIIRDFFRKGYYKEKQSLYEVAKRGKINWLYTIKKQKPIIQDKEVFYLNYIIKKNSIKNDELITLIHKFCVYESFDKFGWIFTGYNPEKPVIKLSKKIMLAIINSKLRDTYKDEDKQLFKNMIAILNSSNSESKSEFKYGTYRFEYVWEKMIDHVFGIIEKENYFPKTTWNLFYAKKADNNLLEPDSIMLYKNKIYVLDAKYYKYGWSKNPKHLPGSASINKQITYGEYIAKSEKFINKGSYPEVYNAFIMPFNCNSKIFPTVESMYCVGIATSDWKNNDEKYQNVIGILMDVKYLMKLDGRNNKKEIIKLAEMIERNCPI